jgi:HEAT repeat protein
VADSASYVLFVAMIALFAALSYLIFSSLYGEHSDIESMVREHDRLVGQVDRERPETDRLLQEILELEEKAAAMLSEKGDLLEKLRAENEKALFSEVYASGMKPDERQVRELAGKPVHELVERLLGAIDESDKLTIALLAAALREKPDEAFEYVKNALAQAQDKRLKFSYLYILSRLRDRRAIGIFQVVLADKSETDILVKRAAAGGLVALPDETSVPVLTDALNNAADWGVKVNSATALGLIKDPRALEPLKREFAGAENAMVRNFALLALAHIADPGCVAYFADIARSDPQESHAVIAVQGLNSIGSPDALKALREIASGGPGPAAEEARRILAQDEKNKADSTKGSGPK